MTTMLAEIPSFLTPEAQVMLWSFVVFFGLLAVLWKFAWGPIMHALEEREHRIQKTIDDAEAKNREALAKMAEYEKRINAAKDEAAKIVAEGKKDVELVKADILKEANAEAARSLERAKREIQLAEQAAIEEIRNKVIDLTTEVSKLVIEREIKSDDHTRFVQDAIARIEKN